MILIVLILSLADALRKNSEEAAERMFKQDSSSTLISYGKYMTYISRDTVNRGITVFNMLN